MGYERNDRRYWRDREQSGYGYRGPDSDRGIYGRRTPTSYGRDYERSDHDRPDYGSRPQGYDYDERGFFDRAGDEVRSWFGDEEAERRRRWDEREQQREYEQRYGRGYDRSIWADYSGYGPAAYGGFDLGAPTSYAPYSGGTYRENSPRSERHDPSYHSWRDRQIQDLDRDYDEYRREHQSKFDNEFGSWRTQRQGQRDLLNQVQEHQEVVGSDGQHVGTVDKIRGDRLILTKTDQDASGHHHSIPCSWITKVSDKVEISKTAQQAHQVWKDEERSALNWGSDDRDHQRGDRTLNKSFSGTY